MTTPEQPVDTRSSVKITRNAKGAAQFEVKVRVGDSETEVEEAKRIALATYRSLETELGINAWSVS